MTIEFKKYFKQIPNPFKIYADFEFNLKTVESLIVVIRKILKSRSL